MVVRVFVRLMANWGIFKALLEIGFYRLVGIEQMGGGR